jgi:hypothetical protein
VPVLIEELRDLWTPNNSTYKLFRKWRNAHPSAVEGSIPRPFENGI